MSILPDFLACEEDAASLDLLRNLCFSFSGESEGVVQSGSLMCDCWLEDQRGIMKIWAECWLETSKLLEPSYMLSLLMWLPAPTLLIVRIEFRSIVFTVT